MDGNAGALPAVFEGEPADRYCTSTPGILGDAYQVAFEPATASDAVFLAPEGSRCRARCVRDANVIPVEEEGSCEGEGSGRWPDSSRVCSDTTSPPCPVYGEDADIGGARTALFNCGQTVFDGVTGLEWERGYRSSLDWVSARSACESRGQGWRLPSISEFQSILDYGEGTGSNDLLPIDVSLFDTEWDAPSFWTSVNQLDGAAVAVGVFSGDSYAREESARLSARCVRGGVPGALTREEGAPVVVRDTRTGLEWIAEAPDAVFEWEQALDHCRALDGDWRLPSIRELSTLQVADPEATLNPVFEGEPATGYWSSTPRYHPYAWAFQYAAYGSLDTGPASTGRAQLLRVRCVRDLPGADSDQATGGSGNCRLFPAVSLCTTCARVACENRCVALEAAAALGSYSTCVEVCEDSACVEACSGPSETVAAYSAFQECVRENCGPEELCAVSVGDAFTCPLADPCNPCIEYVCKSVCLSFFEKPHATELLGCLADCHDQACANDCDAAYAEAADALRTLTECIDTNCASEC